ncbi:MAG: alpha/beta hydrolase [Chloroflexi bacterium]|nr:alpha/beta hydrolase [Chloroflexota bacterium]
MQKPVEFKAGSERLVGDLHLPDTTKPPHPIVVLSHGYMSNRSGEKHLQMGYRFPLEGIAVLRFDHRGAVGGESDGKFEDTTLTTRIEDLKAALDFVKGMPGINSSRIGLLGSSLGGTTILGLPIEYKVKAIVLLSTPLMMPALKPRAREKLDKDGYLEYQDGLRIKKGFFDDLPRHDLLQRLKEIRSPLLIVQGDLDEQVPRHQAFVIYRNANEPKRMQTIAGADHAFTELDKLNEVLALALGWFKKYL